MNNNGTFNATDVRPEFHWGKYPPPGTAATVQHTNTKNNRKIWSTDRPVDILYEVPMDWHHMIPWNVLRNSWSALATSKRWEVLEVWIGLIAVENAAQRLSEMKAGNLDNGEVQDDITERICWAPWNLVEGPNNTNRTDDPGGDGFDAFSGSKFSNNVRSRSQILNQIYTQVKGWAYNEATLSADQCKSLVKSLGSLSRNTPIVMFQDSASAWEVVDPGKIDKYGLATPPSGRHPTWRKVK
jgi:hypothetical protein